MVFAKDKSGSQTCGIGNTAVVASKVVLEVMVKDVSLAGFPLSTTAKHLFYSYAARQMKSKK